VTAVRVLGLDTATFQATVAIVDEHGVLAEAERQVTTHSDTLLALVDETLHAAQVQAAELDGVACGRGPGSFTGLRIGMATAKGLCLATGKPLLCISSLVPLAEAARQAAGEEGGLVAALLDARRQEVYAGLFRDGVLLEPELLLGPGALARRLRERAAELRIGDGDARLLLCGDGALLYRDELLGALGDLARLAPEGCHVIRARHIARAALARLAVGDVDDLAAAAPLYVRPPDARLPATEVGR
jgi:tRNA threonylcarbamoyladenosine biosynthesis protein TsaB